MDNITVDEIKEIVEELRTVYGYNIRKMQNDFQYRLDGQQFRRSYFKKRLNNERGDRTVNVEQFALITKVMNEVVCEEAKKRSVLMQIQNSIVCTDILNKMTTDMLTPSQHGMLYEVLKKYVIEKIKEM